MYNKYFKKKRVVIRTRDKKKTILYVIGTLNVGGTEKHLLNLINNLDRDLFNIDLFILSESGTLRHKINEYVRVHEPDKILNSKIQVFISLYKLTFAIKRIKPDIIHCFLPLSYVISGFAALILGCSKKLIMSRRSLNNYQKKHKFPIRYIEYFLHKFTKLILANSYAVKSQIENEYCDKQKVRVIYNGILENKKINKKDILLLKKKINIKPNDFVFCSVANFIPYKNQHLIIRASASVIKEDKNFKVMLIGGGDKKEYLRFIKSEVHKKKLSNNIIFIGQEVENVHKFFSLCDVGISSSKEEGFSNTILEFLNYGKPVIATKVGGNPELVNNKNGKLVESDNDKEMIEAMKYFLNKKSLTNFKRSAKKTASNFTLKKMIDKYQKVYCEF